MDANISTVISKTGEDIAAWSKEVKSKQKRQESHICRDVNCIVKEIFVRDG